MDARRLEAKVGKKNRTFNGIGRNIVLNGLGQYIMTLCNHKWNIKDTMGVPWRIYKWTFCHKYYCQEDLRCRLLMGPHCVMMPQNIVEHVMHVKKLTNLEHKVWQN
jgi:hypothetical protein